MTILKAVVVTLGMIAIVSILYMSFSYLTWKRELVANLETASEVVDTPMGLMEYRMWGDSGPVMLFLHGSPGGYDQYSPPREAQTAQLRVLTVSRPGYLRTPLTTGRTPEQQADAYAALLDTLDIDKVIVMAASGGGPSGITFAARYPERTSGLIAMAAVSQSIDIDLDTSPPLIATLVKNDFLSWLSLKLILSHDERLVGMVVSGDDNQRRILQNSEAMDMLRRAVQTSQPPSLRQSGVENDTVQMTSLDLPVDSIRIPTLIFHGTADVNVPFKFSEQLAAGIPHAEFAIIEGADHYVRFSHGDEFNERVDAFISEL
jgi:pimeloyl-ACP methyl ester carboxylesterase